MVTCQRGAALTLPVLSDCRWFGLSSSCRRLLHLLPSYALQERCLVPAGIICADGAARNVVASFLWFATECPASWRRWGIGGFALCALAAPWPSATRPGAMTTAAAILAGRQRVPWGIVAVCGDPRS